MNMIRQNRLDALGKRPMSAMTRQGFPDDSNGKAERLERGGLTSRSTNQLQPRLLRQHFDAQAFGFFEF